MKYIKLFEEFEKRFQSNRERKEYYKNLKLNAPIQDRIYTIDQIGKFDIPDEIIDKMKDWEVIFKSPFSDSFYNSIEVKSGYKPDGSFRVSDHWNYQSMDKSKEIHCVTDIPVKDSNISLGQYDANLDRYRIILSLPKPSFTKSQEDKRKKVDMLKDPELISMKKDLKNRIMNKEILAKVVDSDKIYKGIVRKYTGREIKIENESGELIYNNNYLGNQSIDLFDGKGNKIEDPLKPSLEIFKSLKRDLNSKIGMKYNLDNWSIVIKGYSEYENLKKNKK